MTRLRADIWVAAYLRRCASEGASAVLRRRGSPEAGAIFVLIDRLDGRSALLGPAPPSLEADEERGVERRFARAHADEWLTPADVERLLARQIAFDSDLWAVEVEDRAGRDFLDRAG